MVYWVLNTHKCESCDDSYWTALPLAIYIYLLQFFFSLFCCCAFHSVLFDFFYSVLPPLLLLLLLELGNSTANSLIASPCYYVGTYYSWLLTDNYESVVFFIFMMKWFDDGLRCCLQSKCCLVHSNNKHRMKTLQVTTHTANNQSIFLVRPPAIVRPKNTKLEQSVAT